MDTRLAQASTLCCFEGVIGSVVFWVVHVKVIVTIQSLWDYAICQIVLRDWVKIVTTP